MNKYQKSLSNKSGKPIRGKFRVFTGSFTILRTDQGPWITRFPAFYGNAKFSGMHTRFGETSVEIACLGFLVADKYQVRRGQL